MPQGRRLLAVIATTLPLLVPSAAGAATISSNTATPLADDFADNGVCSLREMVAIANADSAAIENACTVTNALGADTIQLGVGNYTLTTPIDGTPDINDGDLETTDSDGLTVLGVGAGSSTIDGGDFDRIFDVAVGAPLTLQNVTAMNGTSSANGGGIAAAADLTLHSARALGNIADSGASGGGISISGAGSVLTLIDATVNTNLATSAGGGVALSGGASIVASTDLSTVTSINGNTSTIQGGGINNTGAGDITLNPGVTVNGNHGGVVGGGIASNSGDPLSDLRVIGASVNGNDVDAGVTPQSGGIHYAGGGGQLELTDAKVQNNTLTGQSGSPGGIFASIGVGTATITRSLISGNSMTIADNATDGTVHAGGGLSISGVGQTTITDSRIFGNTVTVSDPDDFAAGGGIFASGLGANLTITSSTIDGNSASGGLAQNGGGLYVPAALAPTRILNSTFSGNAVGNAVNSGGGAIAATSTASHPLTIAQSTFESNAGTAPSFSGIAANNYTIRGSVFADGDLACAPNTLSGVNGYNVDEGTSCVGVTDDTDLELTSATLGGLLENGGPLYGLAGPTLTHALTGPAPALNLIPPASCEDLAGADLLVDQRGAPRPTDAGCEPGAYEVIPCFGQAAFVGSSGDDVIDTDSFPATDTFHGLDGADTITGDSNQNRLCGGDGGDSILARDGGADQIDCGPGTDSAQTDPLTVDTVINCESVDSGETTTPPPATTPPPGNAGVTGKRAAAIKKCKKKPKGPKRKKCLKKAKLLPL
jgi:hypothetical protein